MKSANGFFDGKRYISWNLSSVGEKNVRLKKRIALATGRRIIAINLPVVGEAVCRTETQMRNTLTNMKQDGLQNRPSITS